MRPPGSPRLALKRGALLATANWPVVLVQFVAEAIFKALLAVPVVGGVVLVVLFLGIEPSDLVVRGPRESIPAVATVLLAQPWALLAFLLAVGVALAGGSALVFAVKGGAVAILAESDRATGRLETAPLDATALYRAGRFSPERFADGARRVFPAYCRLGGALLAAYAVVALASFSAGVGFVPVDDGRWTFVAAGITLLDVVVITGINLLYLLAQIIVAVDGCDAWTGSRRVFVLLQRAPREVTAVFLTALGLVTLGTMGSVLATTALGLIAFVPFVGLAALPLQLLAWLLQGLLFQFLGLASVGAYLDIYRRTCRMPIGHDAASRPTGSAV